LRPRALVVVLVGASLALAACSGAGSPSGQGADDKNYTEGAGNVVTVAPADRDAPPELSSTKLGGGELDVADYRGRVVVVNVWASWCTPCRAETPELVKAAKELSKQDVAFVGINTRDSEASAEAFVRARGVTYPSFYDPDGTLLLGLRKSVPPKSLPSTLVLDQEGRVAASVIGRVSQAKLSTVVGKVLLEGIRASASASASAAASTSGNAAASR